MNVFKIEDKIFFNMLIDFHVGYLEIIHLQGKVLRLRKPQGYLKTKLKNIKPNYTYYFIKLLKPLSILNQLL